MYWKYYLLTLLILFTQTSLAQLPKWIIGNSQQMASGNFYPLSPGNLAFYEADFTTNPPTISTRNLGTSITSITSMGTQDVINNALDASGNILFYLFSASKVAYNNFTSIASDTIYFAAPSTSGQDEIFGKLVADDRVSSVIEHGLCPRPGFPGQYYFIYKSRHGSLSNDDLKYVVVDGNTKTISPTVTIVSNQSIGEGFTISPLNCSQNNHWLFFTKLLSNGNIEVRRSDIDSSGISSPSTIYNININGNVGNSVVTALEISSQGDQIAVCLFSVEGSNKSASLFNLDLSTGNISNERYYTTSNGRIVTCEFSPDGTRIYFLQGGSSSFPNTVYACPVIPSGSLNLNASNQLPSLSLNGSLAMELAFDGKIYINKGKNNSSWYCIQNPNSASPTVISTANPLFVTSQFRIGDAFPDQIDGLTNSVQTPISILLSASADTICNGGSATLTVSGSTSFSWSDGHQANTNNYTVSPTATTTYSVSTLECGGSSDSITIVVTPQPSALISGISNICEGESVTLYGTGGNEYFWNNSLISSADSLVVSPSITTNYSLIVSNGDCNSSSATFTLNVTSSPESVISGDTTICSGESQLLNAVVTQGQAPYTYEWSDGTTSATNLITPLTNQTLSLIVTDQNNCMDTATVEIITEALPVAAFNVNETGCSPVTVSILNMSVNATSNIWYFGDGSSITTNNGNHTYSTPGIYDITLIVSNSIGCTDTLTVNQAVEVSPTPNASVTAQSIDPTNPTQVQIHSEGSYADSCVVYFGDNSYHSGCDPQYLTHTYPDEGTYIITQVKSNSNGCTDTSTFVLVIKGESVFYIPNSFTPDGDEFNNTFLVVFPENAKIIDFELLIFDRWGELLFESKNSKVGWDGTYLGNLVQDGIYIWKLKFNNQDSNTQEHVGHVNVIR